MLDYSCVHWLISWMIPDEMTCVFGFIIDTFLLLMALVMICWCFFWLESLSSRFILVVFGGNVNVLTVLLCSNCLGGARGSVSVEVMVAVLFQVKVAVLFQVLLATVEMELRSRSCFICWMFCFALALFLLIKLSALDTAIRALLFFFSWDLVTLIKRRQNWVGINTKFVTNITSSWLTQRPFLQTPFSRLWNHLRWMFLYF